MSYAIGIVALVALASAVSFAQTAPAEPAGERSRLVALTTAMINGVHWGQVALREGNDADYKGKGDATLFGLGSLTLAQAKNLNGNVGKLLAVGSDEILAWAKGRQTPNTASIARWVDELNAHPAPADPKLPANVLIAYMSQRLTGPEEFFVRAVANLGQLNLELDHDGDQLQVLFKFYIGLGMREIYLPTTEQEQAEAAKILAQQSGKAPYDTDAAGYAMMFRKLNVWFAKNSGQKDTMTLAKELMNDPEVQALLPALKALPPRRVAFLGHSLMMSVHWSTYGSWCDIAGQVVKQVNPGFDYRDFQSGGLTATRAIKEHLDNILAYKPTEVYMLVFLRGEADGEAMTKLVDTLTAAGAQVYIVNDVRPFTRMRQNMTDTFSELAKKPNVHLVDYLSLAKAAPGHETWAAVDNIHMQTPGHIFFAKETLKRWAASATATRP